MARPLAGHSLDRQQGVRRQDWLACPANIFDTPYLARDTEKTNAPVTIPRSAIAELREPIEAAKVRHQPADVRATTFFVDDVERRPWSAMRFSDAFDARRAELARRLADENISKKSLTSADVGPGRETLMPGLFQRERGRG